ncbi:hypothetical protein F4679DRAFT_182854 [Xylaria curta]|nr:hypothetical protein F4679DRAFT_182854 [Xylaria curta]
MSHVSAIKTLRRWVNRERDCWPEGAQLYVYIMEGRTVKTRIRKPDDLFPIFDLFPFKANPSCTMLRQRRSMRARLRAFFQRTHARLSRPHPTIGQILQYHQDGIAFTFPIDHPEDTADSQTYPKLQCERRGLRSWTSIQESPSVLRPLMNRPYPGRNNLTPVVDDLERIAYSESCVSRVLFKTVIERVHLALRAVHPHLGVFPEVKTWLSTGIGQWIRPDIQVYDQPTPCIDQLQKAVIAFGGIKVKQPSNEQSYKYLPHTSSYESWLAQPVQACLDFGIPFGFLLTNKEPILFQIIRMDEHLTTRVTRAQGQRLVHMELDNHDENISSSPDARTAADWESFDDGDDFYSWANDGMTPLSASPPPTPRLIRIFLAGSSPEPSSPLLSLPSSSPVWEPLPSSQVSHRTETVPDLDPTHILIKRYLLVRGDAAIRLWEFLMLAKALKDRGLLKIGPHKFGWRLI